MKCEVCSKELVGRQKRHCSNVCRNKSNNRPHNSWEAQDRRGRERRLKLIYMNGGSCSRCGYSKCVAAISFHHLRDKSFNIDMRTCSNLKWERLVEEAAKCILLCANCHMEEHHSSYGSYPSDERVRFPPPQPVSQATRRLSIRDQLMPTSVSGLVRGHPQVRGHCLQPTAAGVDRPALAIQLAGLRPA